MIVTCPPPETLRRYLLGDFSDGEGAELESHLAECAACEETLSHFDDTHDSLLRHLPLAAGSSADGLSGASPWLERLMQGPPRPHDDQQPGDDHPAEEPAAGLVIEGLENYELTGVLGKGGMGVVYRAVHRQLNRPVAIKVIRPKLFSAAEARQRFAREIQILGGLNHAGIVAATDAGKIGPAAYLVMELIDGVDFSRLVRRAGPLAIGEACEVARQIAAALSAVHEAGAIHRDVKPSNVMLDRAGRVKLLDFGLAHLAEPEREHPETSMGRLLGTLDYMAPEQADGEAVGASADIYAIGATLYYLLTARPPRSGEGQQTLLQQLKSLVQNEIPPLTDLRADVPQQLSDLVAELLAKDPADRPATAQEVAQRLAAWADREAVEKLCESFPNATEPENGASASQSISHSLTELLGSQLASQVEPHIAPPVVAQPPKPAPQPATPSKFRRVGGTLIALAMLGAALWAGITLLIETPSGTIRIESDVAGIQVELLNEQEQTKTLQIKQGANHSELKAGRYRILIAGGHDHLAVTPKEITLQRGEEKIARITQVAAEGEVAQAGTQGEPLYQGEPLSVWEQRFRDETEPLAKIEAGKALILLARPLPPEERFARIMWVGGELIGEGWSTPALKLAFMRDTTLSPNVYRPPTGWPTVERKTAIDAYVVFRNLAGSQLAAEEPVALAARLRDHFAHADLNEAWFVVQMIGFTGLQEHLGRSHPAVDEILGKLIHREDKNLNRVALLRSARYFHHGSEKVQAEYARLLSVMGKKLAETGLPDEEAWLGESWSHTAPLIGVEPQVLAEVAFRQLVDHGVIPTAFDTDPEQHDRNVFQGSRATAIQMAEHWIHLSNRWLEEHQAQPDPERLTSVINALDAPIRLRPIQSNWEIARTKELVTALLKQQYEEQPHRRNRGIKPHQLLTQIILCGGEIPDFAKQPLGGDEMQEKLQAFRTFGRPGSLSSASGILLEAPFATMELLTSLSQTSQNEPSSINFPHRLQVAGGMERSGRSPTASWMRVDSLLIVAILSNLSGQTQDRDEAIAAILDVNLRVGGIHPPIQDLLESEFATRQITEHHLRKIKQRTENVRLLAAIDKLAPGLKDTPEAEPEPKDEPATQPAEVDHSGPEALYQGEPLAVWQQRFEAEIDPLAKIEAGKALVSLARALPEEERFSRIMELGGEFLESGWGAVDSSIFIVWNAGSRGFYSTRWPVDDDGKLENAWHGLLRNIEAQLATIHTPVLATRLAETVSQGNFSEAAFATLATSRGNIRQRISRDPSASDVVLRGLKRRTEDLEEERILNEGCLLIRSQYVHSSSLDAQKDFRAEMEKWALTMVNPEYRPETQYFLDQWFVRASEVEMDSQAFAGSVFANFVGNRTRFSAAFIALQKESPVHGFDVLMHTRRRAEPIFQHWVSLTNQWLEGKLAEDDELPQNLAEVLGVLDIVLRTRRLGDDWPVDKTAELVASIATRVQEIEQDSDFPFGKRELTSLILYCGKDLPEAIRGTDRSPNQYDEVRNLIERYRVETVQTWEGEFLKVLAEEPYHTMVVVFNNWPIVNTDTPLDAIDRLTSRRRDDQLDPLLPLAVAADLTGESLDLDDRIAINFSATAGRRGNQYLSQLQTLRSSSPQLRQIVEHHLRKMRQQAKSEKLQEAIDKLVPGLEDDPEPEVDPKTDPAMQPDDPPAPQPAEVDHSGPEAKRRPIDSRLRTEVQFQALLEHDEMPSGLGTPGSIGERANHYERMKGGARLNVPDLDHWIDLSNRWLETHADDPNPERLTRVMEALTAGWHC